MLRVGLTGGLGSGKSTAARMFAKHGAYVLSADDLAREQMRPGQTVYQAIVEHFGPSVVGEGGSLDRPALARIAFEEGRVEELNAIVHPATIARQVEIIEEIRARDSKAVVIVESALIFETKQDAGAAWRRFDKIVVVVAPTETKVDRFVARVAGSGELGDERRKALADDARRRLSNQLGDDQKRLCSDYVLENVGSLEELNAQVDRLWRVLVSAS